MEQIEIWKTIPEYEDYQVSNLGNVKSLKYGKHRILKQGITKGYMFVVLSKKNIFKTIKTHKLVAICFLNHIPCGSKLVINHIDFNRLNNNLSNLEVVSSRENGNRKHIKSSSKYVGVSFHRLTKKWLSQIQINKKNVYLGIFENELEASNAYQNKLKEII